MVKFTDAVSKISVYGKSVEINNSNQVRKAVNHLFSCENISRANSLKTEVSVNNTTSMSAAELAGRYLSRLDTCGEWAPWSKIGKLMDAKKS